MSEKVKVALTIAGSDSGGGAGIQADLKTFAAHGVHGASAITAVTAQNTLGVVRSFVLEPSLVVAQIEAVAGDLEVGAVKTGMLGSAAVLREVAAVLARLALPHLVVDPVLRATSGEALLEGAEPGSYAEALLPLAEFVTPNLDEAGWLLGRSIGSEEEMAEAARDLHALGARAVVVTGGHLAGDPTDLFYDGARLEALRGRRVETPHTHGTGCTFSAALAALLALGRTPIEAARGAKAYVTAALESSYAVGHGRGSLGPLGARPGRRG